MGKWKRWAIFIILALPFSLIQFLYDPKKIISGATVHWELIPWTQLAVAVIAGLILSFFISGYTVRIYRGMKPAPDFTGWAALFVDGVKLAILWILWFLPLLVVLLAGIALIVLSAGAGTKGAPNIIGIVLLLLLLLVECVLTIIVLLYGILGAVRFARTGSITEGIRFSAITGTIRTIGWLDYILAVVIFMVASVIFAVVTILLGMIPWLGWILVLIITPLFTIFAARFFSLVYDQGETPSVSMPPV